MEPTADARREAALEIQKLAADFEAEDEAAFRRTRIACWVVAAIVTLIVLGVIVLGGDARYLGVLGRLRALQPPPAAADRSPEGPCQPVAERGSNRRARRRTRGSIEIA
jgi:hypothetical protein